MITVQALSLKSRRDGIPYSLTGKDCKGNPSKSGVKPQIDVEKVKAIKEQDDKEFITLLKKWLYLRHRKLGRDLLVGFGGALQPVTKLIDFCAAVLEDGDGIDLVIASI
uniref:Uncharacterized protein n=1 Tax=Strigamia maritima TaxID=126957 RepID=T1IQA1_STRMM